MALLAQRLAFEPRQVDIAEPDRAAIGLDQPHHQPRHRRFAGAGFADQAERLALEDRSKLTSLAACTLRSGRNQPPDVT